MAADSLEIANLALSLIGEASIVTLDNSTPSGRAASLHYLPVRDALLRSHPWNFAQVRAQLTADIIAPLFDWGYAYTMPAACLCLTEINGIPVAEPRTDYLIEGRKILTNTSTLVAAVSTINIIYTSNAPAVPTYDPLFVEILTLKLAIAIADKITQSKSKASELTQQLERIS